jgi:hypothetical protein
MNLDWADTADFQVVCVKCESLGIVLDYRNDAPPTTQIRCSHCNGLRGTLGALRSLAISDRQDLFEF